MEAKPGIRQPGGDDERVLFTFREPRDQRGGVYFTDNKGDTSFFKVSKKMPKIPVLVRWCISPMGHWSQIKADRWFLSSSYSRLTRREFGIQT